MDRGGTGWVPAAAAVVMKKSTKALIVVMVLMVVSAAGTLAVLRQRLVAFGSSPLVEEGDAPSARVVVPRGASTQAIGTLLEKGGVVRNARQFFLYARFIRKADRDMRPGEYDLNAAMTPEEIVRKMTRGEVVTYRFTVPEGSNLKDIARIIDASGLATEDALKALMWDPEFARALAVPESQDHLEGYLFPDTYRFPKGVSAKEILKHMHQRMAKALTDEIKAKGAALNLTPHQIITLASIVEKETGAPEERPKISAVFHNRLRKGMKLQTDPTVIYGIPDYNGNITRKHLEMRHPYNTYVIPGLPPGPICSPGAKALEAAVEPADIKALFFVSMNNGTHVFCETLACHVENVKRWQVEFFKRKRRKG